MIFLKALFGGFIGVVLTWIIVVTVFAFQMRAARLKHGMTGLAASAGGWTYLLHMPLVLLLLTLSFGTGLYLASR